MSRMLGLSDKNVSILSGLVLASATSTALFFLRVVSGGTWRYLFMFWNLALAWLPLLFAWWLGQSLKKHRWLSRQGVILTLLWLGFLPNSFYILSDFIHLRATGEVGLLYDVVVMTAFVFNGLVLGYTSIYIVHQELLKRIPRRMAHICVAVVLLACSFAIYLGRYLRWNTWDILVNPSGILFDVSDRFINPAAYPRTFSTTASFFVVLGMMYTVLWRMAPVIPVTAARVGKRPQSRRPRKK